MATKTTTKKTPAKKTTKRTAKPIQTSSKKSTRKTKTPLKRVSVISKTNPFKDTTLRHQKWKCITDGETISNIAATMKEKGLSSPRTFLANCAKMGHVTIK